MSIYGTLWELRFPRDGEAFKNDEDPGVLVIAQSVPQHIQDDYPFLPPPVSENAIYLRAVVFILADTEKGTERSDQEYRRPLLVMRGRDYITSPFDWLHTTPCEILRERHAEQAGSAGSEDPEETS